MRKEGTLIVILGPTGVGKSDLAMELAEAFSCSIISADSRQMYRGMSIGTAAPMADDLDKVNHHFIGSLPIGANYNASRYEEDVLGLLPKLFKESPVQLLVGGSMLYLDAIKKGIDQMPDIPEDIRSSLKARIKEEGLSTLVKELKKADPTYCESADLKNSKRVLHALEVYQTTGMPFSSFRRNEPKKRNFNIIQVGLNMERCVLYERINRRVDQMLLDGLEEEVKGLIGYQELNALRTVGYQEFFPYFRNEYGRDEAIALIKRNSRRYAKKQLTWFRKDETINWFDVSRKHEVLPFLQEKLSTTQGRC